MKRSALIVQGGWEGHEPERIAKRFRGLLTAEGFEVEVSDRLSSFDDKNALEKLDLIVPVWTMGTIEESQIASVAAAVECGTGLAGCHGMCDAFRGSPLWRFITGGSWAAHPGNDGIEYRVDVRRGSSPLTAGIPDFDVVSEQYYLQVDPAVEVLATTRFPVADGPYAANGVVDMPVAWTKRWGGGRIYYNSLGHHDDVFDIPEALEMMRRGLLWAAGGRPAA